MKGREMEEGVDEGKRRNRVELGVNKHTHTHTQLEPSNHQ